MIIAVAAKDHMQAITLTRHALPDVRYVYTHKRAANECSSTCVDRLECAAYVAYTVMHAVQMDIIGKRRNVTVNDFDWQMYSRLSAYVLLLRCSTRGCFSNLHQHCTAEQYIHFQEISVTIPCSRSRSLGSTQTQHQNK
jgi:hypothetical protein